MNSTTEEAANDTGATRPQPRGITTSHTDTAATDLATLGTLRRTGEHPKKFALATA
jgi:hypothetical protein